LKVRLLLISVIFISFYSCNSSISTKTVSINEKAGGALQQDQSNINRSEGYELMVQKCFICHFEKPDPSKKESMIAPPMIRIQEHYKPSYPTKDKFTEAIIDWVNNPSEKNTLMPGAIRKFNLMPNLHYGDQDLLLISEALFATDFGDMPKMNKNKNRNKGLQLDDGKKWKLQESSITQINSVIKQLDSFKSDDVVAYQQLGKTIFDNAKALLLNDSYSDELLTQIHFFFASVEGNIHMLIASTSLNDAIKQQGILKVKFDKFNNYFE